MTYHLNKGVGKSFEFKGLHTSYVFLALGGIIIGILSYFLLGLFLPFEVTISIVILLSLGGVGNAYYLNAKYGEIGFKLARASKKGVVHVQMNKRVISLIK